MATVFKQDHLNATFSAKLKNFITKSDFDVSLISSATIVFYKPDGTSFSKTANIEADEVNPSQVIALSNIVGDGIEDTITVTVPNTALLKDGERVTISGTTNFNATNKPITIVDATTFTYELESGVGNATPETSGNVTTQGEKKVAYQNTTPETSILDQIGKWEHSAAIVMTNNDHFETRDTSIFWVV